MRMPILWPEDGTTTYNLIVRCLSHRQILVRIHPGIHDLTEPVLLKRLDETGQSTNAAVLSEETGHGLRQRILTALSSNMPPTACPN
jgi:hypothetical protein